MTHKNKLHPFLLFILSFGILDCSSNLEAEKEAVICEDFLVCGVSCPLEELPWLKTQYLAIKEMPQSGIILYQYDSKEVVEVQSSLMSSTNRSQYLCDGTRLVFDTFDTADLYKDFLNKRAKVKILYGIDLWKL